MKDAKRQFNKNKHGKQALKKADLKDKRRLKPSLSLEKVKTSLSTFPSESQIKQSCLFLATSIPTRNIKTHPLKWIGCGYPQKLCIVSLHEIKRLALSNS